MLQRRIGSFQLYLMKDKDFFPFLSIVLFREVFTTNHMHISWRICFVIVNDTEVPCNKRYRKYIFTKIASTEYHIIRVWHSNKRPVCPKTKLPQCHGRTFFVFKKGHLYILTVSTAATGSFHVLVYSAGRGVFIPCALRALISQQKPFNNVHRLVDYMASCDASAQ